MTSNILDKERIISLNSIETGLKPKEVKLPDLLVRTYNADEERKYFNNSLPKRLIEGFFLGYLCKKNK